MKKHAIRLLLSWLFLLATATTCDEPEDYPMDIPCSLKEVELYHWDNAGELPAEPVDNKVPSTAYMLEIRLLTEIMEDEIESYHNAYPTQHVLKDGIEKIQIFTETAFSAAFPKGAEVTSCFANYPKIVVGYQQTDYTVSGGIISFVDKTNRILKALMTIPPPGDYRFRVVLTKESGETVSRTTTPISLY